MERTQDIKAGEHKDERMTGRGVCFERIRRLWYHRLLAYLVGTLDRFNNAKRAEERDRVKHTHLDYWRTEDGDS